MNLAQLLTERRDAIVERFVATRQGGGERSTAALVDEIPSFIDDLIRELRGQGTVDEDASIADAARAARRHGVQRFGQGTNLDTLVHEYGALRHCILMEGKEHGLAVEIDELDQLSKHINSAVASAVTAYTAERDAERDVQQRRIDLLAEAGRVLASSLDSQVTLTHLTNLVVPDLADWCAIHVTDCKGADMPRMPVAHVDPSKMALVRDVYSAEQWRSDGDGALTTTLTGLASDPPSTSKLEPGHRATLATLGARSWIIVPLCTHGRTFGALTIAFAESGRQHTAADVLLAEDLASRAAVAFEHAQLYELATQTRARVEAATRAKDEFVATIAQELRTPLNAILGWTRLIRNGGLAPERHAHAIEIIERNAEAQNQLVGDLLDVSKATSGTVRIDVAQLDVGEVVSLAIESVRASAETKRIVIDADLEADAILRGDAARLLQVFWNLLTNAVKFTPKGGRIDVVLSRVESDIQLIVTDTGIGVEPEFLVHMFDGFRQSDASARRAHGGLGVGLAIAKHLVTLHGGTLVGASDGPGRGAKFTLRLPVSPLVSSTLGVRRAPALKYAEALPRGLDGISVLVVDDEEDARELLQIVLEASGVVVQVVATAAAALKSLEVFHPDVIISDIGMAAEDGYSLIEKIRSSHSLQTRGTPAIALTAYTRPEDRYRALQAGFDLHAGKPADPSALVNMVATLAGRAAEHGNA